MVSNFGPSPGGNSPENGPIWDHKWLKNVSKPWLSQNDPIPAVVPKPMNIAHFEPLLSCSRPLSNLYLICRLSLLEHVPSSISSSQYSILVRVTKLVEPVLALYPSLVSRVDLTGLASK